MCYFLVISNKIFFIPSAVAFVATVLNSSILNENRINVIWPLQKIEGTFEEIIVFSILLPTSNYSMDLRLNVQKHVSFCPQLKEQMSDLRVFN